MRRFHLIEIHEQVWCPAVIRDCATDYLQYVIHATNAYEPIAERLKDAVARTEATRIVDLCSGGGGPWLRLEQTLATKPRGRSANGVRSLFGIESEVAAIARTVNRQGRTANCDEAISLWSVQEMLATFPLD